MGNTHTKIESIAHDIDESTFGYKINVHVGVASMKFQDQRHDFKRCESGGVDPYGSGGCRPLRANSFQSVVHILKCRPYPLYEKSTSICQ